MWFIESLLFHGKCNPLLNVEKIHASKNGMITHAANNAPVTYLTLVCNSWDDAQ